MKSQLDTANAVQHINILRYLLADDGTFPNNALLPLLVYRNVFNHDMNENMVKEIFESNRWVNSWKNGVYNYHHYHSSAHEVLGIVKGSARLQFGGPSGVSIFLEQGDVVIIPAGVAHKNIGDNSDFVCIGAYPEGQEYDMNYGKEGERPATDEQIKELPVPETDPVYGTDGPLIKNWTSQPDQHYNIL